MTRAERFQQIEDLGLDPDADRTEDLRRPTDAPRAHKKGDPGCHPNRPENTHQHL